MNEVQEYILKRAMQKIANQDEMKAYLKLLLKGPQHAVTMSDGTFLYDSVIRDDKDWHFNDSMPPLAVQGYDHAQLVKRVTKALPALLEEYKEYIDIPDHIKRLKLLGIGRTLYKTKDGIVPWEYTYHIGSPDDPNFSFNDALRHGITANYLTPDYIEING